MSYSTEVNKKCICDIGYYMNINLCDACDNSCLSCYGNTYYNCLSCLDNLLENVCLPICPVGYNTRNNTCINNNPSTPSIAYIFTPIQGIFIDSINNIQALTGNNSSYYPNLDSTDPLPAYGRGIYFTGNGSYLSLPYDQNQTLLFGIRFFISI